MVNLNKPTRTLILSMSVLVIIAFFILKGYYKNQNASVDPRIIEARELYEAYNAFTKDNKLDSVFWLMDTIESIYSSVPHYKNSYEMGVLHNNRAAAWLTIALYSEYRDSLERDSLVLLANAALNTSLEIYQNWQENYGTLSEAEIKINIKPSFMQEWTEISGINTKIHKGKSQDASVSELFLNNRVREIINSQTEVPRRMSVSYTNLGIIHRYNIHYDSAIQCYEKAIELWERNLTAKNNMNLLLNRPMEKQNIIQKLFPPERLD